MLAVAPLAAKVLPFLPAGVSYRFRYTTTMPPGAAMRLKYADYASFSEMAVSQAIDASVCAAAVELQRQLSAHINAELDIIERAA